MTIGVLILLALVLYQAPSCSPPPDEPGGRRPAWTGEDQAPAG